jgi:hypothetical protein
MSQKTSRWIGALILIMLVLRVGTKYYRSQQRPSYETQMQEAQARQRILAEALRDDQDAQRAAGATAVVADSAVLAADTAIIAK